MQLNTTGEEDAAVKKKFGTTRYCVSGKASADNLCSNLSTQPFKTIDKNNLHNIERDETSKSNKKWWYYYFKFLFQMID